MIGFYNENTNKQDDLQPYLNSALMNFRLYHITLVIKY